MKWIRTVACTAQVVDADKKVGSRVIGRALNGERQVLVKEKSESYTIESVVRPAQ